MSDQSHSRLLFRCLTAASLSATLALALWAAAHEGRAPDLAIVLPCAALVVASANVQLYFSTPITISTDLLVVMAAVVALDRRGWPLGTLVIGGSGCLVWHHLRDRRFSAILVNFGGLALSAGAGAATYHGLLAAHAPLAVVYVLTVGAYVAINWVIVVPAVALKGGQPVRAVLSEVSTSATSLFIFGIAGLLVGQLYRSVGPLALLAVVAPAVVARTVFVSVVRFRVAYRRLETLYAFTTELSQFKDERDAIDLTLHQLLSLLSAGTAEVTLLSDDGWRRTSLTAGSDGVRTEEGIGVPREHEAVTNGAVRVSEAADVDPLPDEMAARGLREAMLAPLRSDKRLLGTVVVAEPAGGGHFSAGDLRLFETLAHHVAVSLSNSRLLDQLRFDSRHDRLTGLPNRSRFNELVDELPRAGAVLLIDLDRFKEVNDTLGHSHGDRLLRSVAARIVGGTETGIVARLGGDEFGVLLPEAHASDAAQMAVSLLGALEQPFHLDGLALELTASIGVALKGSDGDDAGKLLQQADVAMYSAKSAHSGWEMYAPDRDHHSPQRLAMAGELRRAIDDGDLEVHYQPKADLRTGMVVGLEALVRWRHSRYGLIGPDHFIPVAERTGLIRSLTLFVLHDAGRLHAQLRQMGRPLDVAVNLSVRSVVDVNLPDQVAEVISRYDMDPATLTLEITEGSVMSDPARAIGILGRLAALGTQISIDDFGTGYSSLAYLKRLPASEVKVDRTFMSGLINDGIDAAIVRSTVDLARNLGLRAVAEGVEDGQTWSRLVALGCDQAQGYFISPALPVPDLHRWLERTRIVGDQLH